MRKTNTQPASPAGNLPAMSPEVKAKVAEWSQISAWLEQGKAREQELRKELAALFVPNPKEGTNNVQGLGFAVKVGHKVSRTLDEAALDSVMPQLPENLRVIGTLISYKPAFNLEAYRALSEADRKIFDQALTIKDGSPTLEIIVGEVAPAPSAIEGAIAAHTATAPTARASGKPKRTSGPGSGHPLETEAGFIAAAKRRAAKPAKPAPKKLAPKATKPKRR